jgi:hypothetical protein
VSAGRQRAREGYSQDGVLGLKVWSECVCVCLDIFYDMVSLVGHVYYVCVCALHRLLECVT